jgi:aspartate aminotransferase
VPVSATLAANEALARRRTAGEPVLPLAFGEAGLPVPPALLDALGAVTGGNDYGPVAGRPELRTAAAGYWARRGLPTATDAVVSGPVYDTAPALVSPAVFAPERTVVTTALSKSLALGGWRIGVARMPDGRLGRQLRDRLLGIGSEIWSAPAGPIQEAAALAFTEPREITERVRRSRRLHAAVCRAVAATFAAAG